MEHCIIRGTRTGLHKCPHCGDLCSCFCCLDKDACLSPEDRYFSEGDHEDELPDYEDRVPMSDIFGMSGLKRELVHSGFLVRSGNNDLPVGETLILFGEEGSGKSLVANALVREALVTKPISLIRGKDMVHPKKRETFASHLALVSQAPGKIIIIDDCDFMIACDCHTCSKLGLSDETCWNTLLKFIMNKHETTLILTTTRPYLFPSVVLRKAHVHQVGIVQTSLDLPLAMGETFAGVPVRVTGEENALISIKMFGATVHQVQVVTAALRKLAQTRLQEFRTAQLFLLDSARDAFSPIASENIYGTNRMDLPPSACLTPRPIVGREIYKLIKATRSRYFRPVRK